MTTQQFITGCAETYTDQIRFKNNLRDYLISLREWTEGGGGAGQANNADLYQEDKDAAAAAAEKQRAEVPGMVKPSEMKDEDEELI